MKAVDVARLAELVKRRGMIEAVAAGVARLERLLDLAAQARREGREDDVLLYLQEALAEADRLPKKATPP